MLNVKIVCIAATLAAVGYVPQASAQCYPSAGPSLTNGPNGTGNNGFASMEISPSCQESAKKYPNSYNAGVVEATKPKGLRKDQSYNITN